MNNFENLNILITGASGGIGTSLSKTFSSTNANLFLLGSSSEKISMLREELPSKENIRFYLNPFNLKIEPIPTDFSGQNYYNNYGKYKNFQEFKITTQKLPKFFSILYENKDFQNFVYQIQDIEFIKIIIFTSLFLLIIFGFYKLNKNQNSVLNLK